jgi:hypothetical protein
MLHTLYMKYIGRKRLVKSTSASHTPIADDKRLIETGEWMDNRRLDLRTYEYMCHLAEAKEYIMLYLPVILTYYS